MDERSRTSLLHRCLKKQMLDFQLEQMLEKAPKSQMLDFQLGRLWLTSLYTHWHTSFQDNKTFLMLEYSKINSLLTQSNFISLSPTGSLWSLFQVILREKTINQYLSDPGKPGIRSIEWVPMSVRDLFWELADVTLADEYISPVLSDNVNRTIQGNVAVQVAPLGGQIHN